MTGEVRVVDVTTRKPVPAEGSSQGEIVIRGNTVMKGYYRDPAATAEAFAEGSFCSGDIAVVHPDGYIEIRDRLKDVIVSGEENIFSVEVENVLHRHPAIAADAVVARSDEKWSETPSGFVELNPGMTASGDEIIAHCRQHLAGFEVPKHVVFGELPKTATGKIQKLLLRQRTHGH